MTGGQGRMRSPATWLLLIVVWLAATAGLRPLMLPDEGRYGGIAWEMLSSGDWLTPTIDGLPFFHKPPLFYWIGASAMAVTGPHAWTARLPSMLGAATAAFALFLFVRRWVGARAAMASLGVLLTLPMFFFGAQYANLDMLVAGCISSTVLLAAHAALEDAAGRRARGALAGAYACAALGVLAKGLIGALLPALIVGGWLLLTRRFRTLLALAWWPGLLLFLALSAPWFLAMQQRYPEFLNYFFMVQHFQRFTQGGFNNAMPFWFFPAVLALLSLNWIGWLPSAVRPRVRPEGEGAAIRALMWIWLLVVVIFFSIPKSKLVGYVLPALPPLAFLLGQAVLAAHDRGGRGRWLWRVAAGAGVAVCLVGVVTLARLQPRSAEALGEALRAQRPAGQPVVFVDRYHYDLPFYARLTDGVAVLERWDDPEIEARDNWRKELFDAGRFAPLRSAELLIGEPELHRLLCASPVVWVVGDRDAPARHAFLAGAAQVATTRDLGLWRVTPTRAPVATAPGC